MKINIAPLWMVVALAAGACSSSSGKGNTGGTGGADAASIVVVGGSGGADGGVADARDAAPVVTCGPFADGGAPDGSGGDTAPSPMTTFFVTSQKNATGDLGGLAGADLRCQTLAAAVGLGN
jgi:hypothetical protein